MYKIYSRARIRIPKIKFFNGSLENKKRKKISKIIVILIIAFSTCKFVLDAVLPIFDNLCENEAKSVATIICNKQATDVMTEYSYDDFFVIEKNENGNISVIKTNIVTINGVISEIATRIQEEINQQGRDNITIAIGSFTGLKLLAGRGPGVKIRVSTIGNVETDLRSEFSTQGVNQTLHRIYLQIVCNVEVLTPFDDISSQITNQVLLAENVILGDVPSAYYNLEGLNNDDAIEIIEGK